MSSINDILAEIEKELMRKVFSKEWVEATKGLFAPPPFSEGRTHRCRECTLMRCSRDNTMCLECYGYQVQKPKGA